MSWVSRITNRLPSRKSFTFYTFTFVLFFSLGAALRTNQNAVQLMGFAQNSPPQLYFMPGSGKISVGQTLPVKIYLDSGSQVVESAEVIVSFDPSLAELKAQPLPGPAFASASGKLTPAGGGLIQWSGSGELKGVNYLLSFKLTPLQKGELKVSFDQALVDGTPLEIQSALFQVE